MQILFQMTLTATDGGDPMRYVNQEFTLVFVSTLGPEFVKNELTVWIKENKTGLDYREPIPKAYDMISDDGDNTIAIYYFLMNEGRFGTFTPLSLISCFGLILGRVYARIMRHNYPKSLQKIVVESN